MFTQLDAPDAVANDKLQPVHCVKSEFEQVFEQEFNLSCRSNDELSLLSLKIMLNEAGAEDSYHQLFEDYVNGLMDSINERLRSTDVVCRCSALHIIILCRKTARAQALEIAGHIQDALLQARNEDLLRIFGLRVNCVSVRETSVKNPGELIQQMLTRHESLPEATN